MRSEPDNEAREFWAHVDEVARQVRAWPEDRCEAARVAVRPELARSRLVSVEAMDAALERGQRDMDEAKQSTSTCAINPVLRFR